MIESFCRTPFQSLGGKGGRKGKKGEIPCCASCPLEAGRRREEGEPGWPPPRGEKKGEEEEGSGLKAGSRVPPPWIAHTH